MVEAIRQSVESVKGSHVRYSGFTAESSLCKISSDKFVVNKVAIDQSGLDRMTEERVVRNFYEDIMP